MIKNILDIPHIIGYDIEVYRYGWSITFDDFKTGERTYLDSGENSLTNSTGMDVIKHIGQYPIDDLLLVAFNNKGYDNHILRVIERDFTYAQIKEYNDFIIDDNDKMPWEWESAPGGYFEYHFTDLMDDLAERMSLKMIEGNLGLPIRESEVSFNIDRPLTRKEWESNREYNGYDNEVLKILFDERLTYLNTKIELGIMGGLNHMESLKRTNANLVAAYLAGPRAKAVMRKDDYDYVLPDNIRVSDERIVSYFMNSTAQTKPYDIDIAGVSHTLAHGGLHGAIPTYIDGSDEEWEIILADGEQFYPSIIVLYNYFSRSMKDKNLFKQSVSDRLKYKALKDDRQNTLKLVNNTAYGTMGAKFNALYDKLMANSTCFTGQLLLIDLIEKLESGLGDDFQHIQSNTDGIMYKYRRSAESKMFAICDEWQERTQIVLDYDPVKRVGQRDVNNYIMLTESGKIEVLGGHLKQYHGRNYIDGQLVIVAKAIGDYLLYNKSIYDTIMSSTDILDFQMLTRTGRKFDTTHWESKDGIVEVNRVNRVYAVKDKRQGSLYKIRHDGHKDGPKRDKVASVPLHLVVDNENNLTLDDIDKEWYINLATKRAYAFLGKGGMDKMSEKLPKQAERKTYLKKSMESNEVRVFEKGDIIPQEWDNEDVIKITRRIYLDIVEKEPEEVEEEKDMAVINLDVENVVEPQPEVDEMPCAGVIFKDEPTEDLGVTVGLLQEEKRQERSDRISFYKARSRARDILNNAIITKDGFNSHGGYGYMTADMVKSSFSKALVAAGMEFELHQLPDTYEVEKLYTPKMHLIKANAIITLIDVATGYSVDYEVMNVATDSSDKGYNKVTTAIVKYFVINNFLVKGEEFDPDADHNQINPDLQNQTKQGWVSEETKEEMKQEIVAKVNKATPQEVDILQNLCLKVKEEVLTDGAESFLSEVRDYLTAGGLEQEKILQFTLRAEQVISEESAK